MTVKIVGRTAVVQTAITKAAYDRVKRWKPEALSLTDSDGRPTFTLSCAEVPSISKYGATLISMPNGKLGFEAVGEGETIDELKANFVEKFGGILAKLSEVEEQVKILSETLKTKETMLMNSITVE